MKVADIIQQKLTDAFAPEHLHVQDDSHLHRGHAGAPAGGESHFTVVIVSPEFATMSKIQRHKAIHSCLKEELASHIHALSIKALTPDENTQR